jgi:type I restriction enzyme S subunit
MKNKSKWQEYSVDEIKSDKKNALAMGPFGSNITTDNFVPFGVPVIRGTNLEESKFREENFVYLTEEKANQLCSANAHPGDIIFTHRGTIGQVGIIPYDAKFARYVVSQSQMKLSCDTKKADPFFVYYYFISPTGQHQLLSNTSTTGVPALAQPLTSLKRIPILLPPIDQQKKISYVLQNLDKKIKVIHNINRILEKIIQAIFKSWFTNFDGQTEFFGSELGQIPKGWKVGCLGELCDFVMGQSPPSSSYNEIGKGEVFYQGISDFGNFFPYPRVYCTMPKKFALPKDILFSVRAPIGSINVANQRCCIGRGLAALRLKKNHGPFLYYLLQSTHNEWQSFEEDGTIFGAVTKNNINDFKIIIPPPELIIRFNLLTNPLYAKIWNNNLLIRTLTEIRDSLLPKLMSGEIKV